MSMREGVYDVNGMEGREAKTKTRQRNTRRRMRHVSGLWERG